jgi:hypothetical protein
VTAGNTCPAIAIDGRPSRRQRRIHSVNDAACAAQEEPDMEPTGLDMGDYQERYRDFDIEIAVEQVLTGVKAHFRVLKQGVVALDWRLVHIDRFWPTERAAAEAALRAARDTIDKELENAAR